VAAVVVFVRFAPRWRREDGAPRSAAAPVVAAAATAATGLARSSLPSEGKKEDGKADGVRVVTRSMPADDAGKPMPRPLHTLPAPSERRLSSARGDLAGLERARERAEQRRVRAGSGEDGRATIAQLPAVEGREGRAAGRVEPTVPSAADVQPASVVSGVRSEEGAPTGREATPGAASAGISLRASHGFCEPSLDDHEPSLRASYSGLAPGPHDVYCTVPHGGPKVLVARYELRPGTRPSLSIVPGPAGKPMLARPD
jgi:hypothetical protein